MIYSLLSASVSTQPHSKNPFQNCMRYLFIPSNVHKPMMSKEFRLMNILICSSFSDRLTVTIMLFGLNNSERNKKGENKISMIDYFYDFLLYVPDCTGNLLLP